MAEIKKAGGRPFVELPESEQHPDYFRLLVSNCVAAYARTYNDRLTLDYNQVIGKMRALVLDDSEYQKQTRSIRAKRIIDEAEELEELAALARGVAVDGDDVDDPEKYDSRPGARKGKTASADKDEINLRFKVAQERRIFLNLNANTEDADEAEALNLFFVPITREEAERLETVEVGVGEDDGGSALAEGEKQSTDVERRLRELAAEAKGPQDEAMLYVTNPDGTIEEV
jgi:hypothetical protein